MVRIFFMLLFSFLSILTLRGLWKHIPLKKISQHPIDFSGVVMIALYGMDCKLIVLPSINLNFKNSRIRKDYIVTQYIRPHLAINYFLTIISQKNRIILEAIFMTLMELLLRFLVGGTFVVLINLIGKSQKQLYCWFSYAFPCHYANRLLFSFHFTTWSIK